MSSKKKPNVRYDSLEEVIKAREFLEENHSGLLQNDDKTKRTFIYIGGSIYEGHKRYHFFLNGNKKIIYIAISAEEREKVIELFKEKVESYADSYTYIDSAIGMIPNQKVYHRFYSEKLRMFAYMPDEGNIQIIPFLESEDMD